MQVIKNILTENRCYKAGRTIIPKGIMVHSTATPGAMAKNFLSSWNNENKDACVHAFIDNTGIYQTLPWNWRAWHCAAGGNNTHISLEICEPKDLNDADYFNTVWNYAVELVAFLCQEYGLTANDVICHSEGYAIGIASNHADVMHWFPLHNKSMDDFRNAVSNRLNGDEDELATIVSKIAADSGKSEDEVVSILTFLVRSINTSEADWQKEGVQKLKDMGMINSDHDAREPLGFGTFGLMMERFKTIL